MAILSYHKVDFRFEVGATRVTPKQFKKQIEYLIRGGYKICSLKEYFVLTIEKKVALTFDDAYESVFDYAYPILEEAGASFTIFPVGNFIGEYNSWEVNLGWRRFKHMSWTQLLSMKNVEIGSHTISHRCLTRLSADEIFRELTDSRKILEDKSGQEISHLSLPFGRYDNRIAQIAKDAGYQKIFSMNPFDGEGGFVCGRYGVYLIDNLKSFSHKLIDGYGNSFEKHKLRIYNALSAGTIIVKGLRGDDKYLTL